MELGRLYYATEKYKPAAECFARVLKASTLDRGLTSEESVWANRPGLSIDGRVFSVGRHAGGRLSRVWQGRTSGAGQGVAAVQHGPRLRQDRPAG